MQNSLLTTKLYFPPARPVLVHRPRLVERLQTGLQGPLTLLSAPAGSGKTTLLSEWRAGLGTRYPVGWVSLSADDNDLTRFLQYLITALDNLQGGIAKEVQPLLQTSETPHTEAILTRVINSLGDLEHESVLVFDDYHLVELPAIHTALTFLLDNLPPRLHLVLLTRSDPPLPLARLRARGHLTEIRADHLRFSVEECTRFLNHVMSLDLTGEQVAALEKRTEGWIAGLQLAALSMQGREDVDGFVSAFTGSNHYIVDYLAEEVLNRQPEPVREFLLKTSILERLTGPLCDMLTGRADGQEMLEHLVHSNLFIIPMDGSQCWYRIHQLFGDLLRLQLHSTHEDQLSELHRRAGHWNEMNGNLDQAIRHYLAAKEWKRAASLMEAASQDAIRHGEVYKIKSWVESLPDSFSVRNPRLLINLGWATVLNGQFDQAQEILKRAEALVQEDPVLKIDWLAALVFTAAGKGKPLEVIELAHKALEVPQTGNILSRCQLLSSLSVAYWHLGRIRETAAVTQEAARLAEQGGDWHTRSIMLARYALVQAALGNLKLSEKIYSQAALGQSSTPERISGGIVQHYMGALYYEWNELEQAAACIKLAEEYSRITGHIEININVHRQLAYLYQAQGENQSALQALDRAEDVAREHNLSAKLKGQLAASRVQVALAQGDLLSASYWLEQIHDGYGASFHYPRIPLEPAKLALVQGDKAGAAAILAERYEIATQDGNRYAQIEIRILQALAAKGIDKAIAYLSEALSWAEPEKYLRIFRDQGNVLVPVLREAFRRGVMTGYTTRLLALFSNQAEKTPTAAATYILTKREIELLGLIAAGSSNKEIAAELVISIGTVKRHTVNIFNKLDVKNRTEAVAKARELGLL
jgi:LuxR family maltose regulon positive regulatory protein